MSKDQFYRRLRGLLILLNLLMLTFMFLYFGGFDLV